MNDGLPPSEGLQETFISHLIELRSRLLRSIVAIVVVLFVHVCAAHVPVQYWQAPAPLHLPVVPHEVCAVAAQSLACVVLFVTTAHVPSATPV